MLTFDDYKDRFTFVRLEKRDGILELAIHTDGGPCVWDGSRGAVHDELGQALSLLQRELDIKVMILTGTGDAFCAKLHMGPGEPMTPMNWERINTEGRSLLQDLLDIPYPVIGAVNGDAFIHAELAVLSDIVIAAEGARFADKAHAINGVTPSDGVHVVWPMLLGPNRGRHFLLTGAEIDAAEAQRLGFVAEVVPKAKLKDRAWEVARELAAKPQVMLRSTRNALTLELKRRMLADLGYGLVLEGMGVLDVVEGYRQLGSQGA